MMTVNSPATIVPPWAVESPILAAGIPPIITVAEPVTMLSGGPAQAAISPIRAAGIFPIKTVRHPGPVTGPPTCGFGPSDAGHTCISVTLAAGGI